MKKIARLCGAAFLFGVLAACGYITHELTQAPGMDALVGHSFATAQDAFLIDGACIYPHSIRHCAQLQVVRGFYYSRAKDQNGWVPMRLPGSASAAAGFPEVSRLKFVQQGSKVTITHLVSFSLGQYRRCWLVYGRLEGMPEDLVVELPACFQWAPESEPMWFHAQPLPAPAATSAVPNPPIEYDYMTKPPLPDPAFLTPLNK